MLVCGVSSSFKRGVIFTIQKFAIGLRNGGLLASALDRFGAATV